MTNPRGFLEISRRDRAYRPVAERVKHWAEFVEPLRPVEVRSQAERCMDCGVPFCHTGCPVNNLIPEWNELVTKDDWRAALERLHRTNNFPEFTGRLCPAPCEAACTLNLDDAPVTIKTIECEIIDRGWREGWITHSLAQHGTGHRIAVVGSGPAGLACAQQLARMGHAPTIFEKSDRIGGLLRYGIPDFKLDKGLIDRRIDQMQAEGVIFRTDMEIGVSVSLDRLMDDYPVIVLAGGAEQPRDLDVPGRGLGGVHYAMDYLVQQNRRGAGLQVGTPILATGKKVVVIGGGDTGSDCIGTAHRQGAASVTQLEILPQPPINENKATSWPHWPTKLRTSSSQEEGAAREFSVVTTQVDGEGVVSALICDRGGERFEIEADLVLLAMGFTGSPPGSILARAGVGPLGSSYETDRPGIFACGDMRRGQSLIVWAIREGRECAAAVDRFLLGANEPRAIQTGSDQRLRVRV
jgi:glutamate synthase (NADPH/NADH) small chain